MKPLKKILFLLTLWSTLSMGYTPADLYATLTATRGRKIACALLVALAAHKVYKAYCHAAIKKSAQRTPEQPSMANERPTRWLFVHGVGDRPDQADKYVACDANPYGFMPADYTAVEFDDAVKNLRDAYQESGIPWKDLLNIRNKAALAQDADIAKLKEFVESRPQENFILFGVSRGAATIINYVAMHKPSNIKALILESPFDDMQSVVSGLLSNLYLHYMPGLSDIGNLICAGLFRRYSTCGVAPIDVVAHIPKHIPVLFICSREDRLIPAASTNKLYRELADAGHLNTLIFQTDHGGHAEIIRGSSARVYKNAVDGFMRSSLSPLECAHK